MGLVLKQRWRLRDRKMDKTMVKTMVKPYNTVKAGADSRHLHFDFSGVACT